MADTKMLADAARQHGHGARVVDGVLQISIEPLDVYGDSTVKYRSFKNPTVKNIKSFLGYKSGGLVKKYAGGGLAVRGQGKIRKII